MLVVLVSFPRDPNRGQRDSTDRTGLNSAKGANPFSNVHLKCLAWYSDGMVALGCNWSLDLSGCNLTMNTA